jgi:hypothetical protein
VEGGALIRLAEKLQTLVVRYEHRVDNSSDFIYVRCIVILLRRVLDSQRSGTGKLGTTERIVPAKG